MWCDRCESAVEENPQALWEDEYFNSKYKSEAGMSLVHLRQGSQCRWRSVSGREDGKSKLGQGGTWGHRTLVFAEWD